MAGQLEFVIEIIRIVGARRLKSMFTRVDNQLITCCWYASRSWDLHQHWQQ